MEYPKSSVKILDRKSRYCTQRGLSKPYFASRKARISGSIYVISSPSRFSTGSPGIKRGNIKFMVSVRKAMIVNLRNFDRNHRCLGLNVVTLKKG